MSQLLSTIWPQLRDGPLHQLPPLAQDIFRTRLAVHEADFLQPWQRLYAHHPHGESTLARLLHIVAQGYAQRPYDLHLLDQKRLTQPDWFQQAEMIGYVCYADRFARDHTLKGVAQEIPYLKELGVTYLHLMPLLQPRPGANDGGYAVMDYRQVNEKLGTMADLAALTAVCRQHNISVCIDLVCNHTAKEHEWARKAWAGDPVYQDYYLMFPDRTLPDQYEQTLPEIFPDFAPGNFTHYPEIGRWVWTTFNEYQWDLNYQNPAVLCEMLAVILYLANQGVEVLRLDAVAFMWKRLGTDSQNQPEAQAILQVFRALSRMAAPGLILKAEAIVAPDKLVAYLGQGEAANKVCELAYHNVFMVLLWSALAEGKVNLLTHVLQKMPAIPWQTAWCTYSRCHDDIGWAITEADAAGVGLDGFAHRAFLSDFYSGRFPGTVARGTTFQYNAKTGDRRINGSLASLAGLEAALEMDDAAAIRLAIGRILWLHSLILAFGGIPLLYMGDELGLLNDRSYLADPDLALDSRWLHRPFMDWAKAAQRHDRETAVGRVFQGVCQLIQVRKRLSLLHAQAATIPVWTPNEHVLGLIRSSPRGRLLILANATSSPQSVSSQGLEAYHFDLPLHNHLDESVINGNHIYLHPYQTMWLERLDDMRRSP